MVPRKKGSAGADNPASNGGGETDFNTQYYSMQRKNLKENKTSKTKSTATTRIERKFTAQHN